jgi:hypothetical protein
VAEADHGRLKVPGALPLRCCRLQQRTSPAPCWMASG